MSKSRLLTSYAFRFAALVFTAWLVKMPFPLQAGQVRQAQQVVVFGRQDHISVFVSGFAEPVRNKLQARMREFQGRSFNVKLRAEISKAAKKIEPAAQVVMTQSEAPDGSVVTTYLVTDEQRAILPGGALSSILPFPPASAGSLPPATGTRISLAGPMPPSRLIQAPRPAYPELARQARIQGNVRFSALIDKEGRVANSMLVSGHPLLIPAAQEVVGKWVYQPTLLNGEPVKVVTQIDVEFKLP